jgi:transcriptional regulator with XRE-family HTH domain
MANKGESEDIAELVRTRRIARGLTQADLAAKIGTNQQTIGKIEKGTSKHSRVLPAVLAELGVSLDVLTTRRKQPKTEEAPHPSAAPPLFGAHHDFPIHGAAEGGRGAIIVSTDPVEYMARPQPLANVKDAYGIIVIEASMEPEFQPGDIALVHPHLPPTNGSTCVFYSRGVDGTVQAVIKRLRRSTADQWHVQQWNPKRSFTLKKSEWQTCHVTVGRYTRR